MNPRFKPIILTACHLHSCWQEVVHWCETFESKSTRHWGHCSSSKFAGCREAKRFPLRNGSWFCFCSCRKIGTDRWTHQWYPKAIGWEVQGWQGNQSLYQQRLARTRKPSLVAQKIKLTQDIVEQIAVVLVWVETVLDGRWQTSVDMAIVQFSVQCQEDLIYMTESTRVSHSTLPCKGANSNKTYRHQQGEK